MFKSKIHLELMFVYGSVIDQDLFFHTDTQLSQRCFFGKEFVLLYCFGAFVENQWPYKYVSECTSILLIYFLVSLCQYQTVLIAIALQVVLKSSSMPTPSFTVFFFFKIVLLFLGALYLHIHFRISLFMSRKCLLGI